jgi:hypothetical protein
MAQHKQYGSNIKYVFDLNTGNECHIKKYFVYGRKLYFYGYWISISISYYTLHKQMKRIWGK